MCRWVSGIGETTIGETIGENCLGGQTRVPNTGESTRLHNGIPIAVQHQAPHPPYPPQFPQTIHEANLLAESGMIPAHWPLNEWRSDLDPTYQTWVFNAPNFDTQMLQE